MAEAILATVITECIFGKAREVYSALSLAQSTDYDVIKKNVLKAYELVPEAYRQRCRNYKKFMLNLLEKNKIWLRDDVLRKMLDQTFKGCSR